MLKYIVNHYGTLETDQRLAETVYRSSRDYWQIRLFFRHPTSEEWMMSANLISHTPESAERLMEAYIESGRILWL